MGNDKDYIFESMAEAEADLRAELAVNPELAQY